MKYSDKLNLLFKTTHSKGKELAEAMFITPPQISKMRKGQRGLPKNKEDAYSLALFFAQRCIAAEKREALAQAIKLEHVKNLDNEADLAEVILSWLQSERDDNNFAANKAAEFFTRYSLVFDGAARNQTEPQQRAISSESNSLLTYFGTEGKRLAVINFFNYLQKRKQAYTVNLLTDENIAWVNEDSKYTEDYQSALLKLTENGCIFRRIVGPIFDINQAFDSITRWLPLYITGKATSYYYKRMRDNLNKITIFVVQDVAVLFSFSVAAASEGVTFFTTDLKTVNVMMAEFEKYFALCQPIMQSYCSRESADKLNECMLRYESYAAPGFQLSNFLSFITVPWNIATSLHSDDAKSKNLFLAGFAKRYKAFISNLTEYPFIDLIRLADIDDIMMGKVPIPAAMVLSERRQYYTPQTYIQHLKSVLYLLEHNKNYSAIILKKDNINPVIIYVKEGHCSIIARDTYPYSVFEASESNLVEAFTEHIRRVIAAYPAPETCKRNSINAIRALITEIDGRI